MSTNPNPGTRTPAIPGVIGPGTEARKRGGRRGSFPAVGADIHGLRTGRRDTTEETGRRTDEATTAEKQPVAMPSESTGRGHPAVKARHQGSNGHSVPDSAPSEAARTAFRASWITPDRPTNPPKRHHPEEAQKGPGSNDPGSQARWLNSSVFVHPAAQQKLTAPSSRFRSLPLPPWPIKWASPFRIVLPLILPAQGRS